MLTKRALRTTDPYRRVLSRGFSVLNRPSPNYPGHVPLTTLERGALAVGSAIGSLINPRRADLIAALGEATATPYFIYRLRDVMLSDPTGRRILRNQPSIGSKTLSVEYLRSLSPNTVGRTYVDWLDREGVGPDTRAKVQYIDDKECAYVMQRYRECHDFYHAITGLPVVVEGEIALKTFEFANTLLPMTGLSMFAVMRLKPEEQERFWKLHLPWAVRNGLASKAIINVYWEEQLERDVDELRKELGIEKPVDLRETRKIMRRQKKMAEEAAKTKKRY
ncbi:ubiquinone biosynthesis protein COQ4 [Histoplasma ohiense]|nr:ubiquinone biosynthesis protein COQ4 [Histoplasma ohiense (nom. inval.)]